jgi:hypothetical protein
LRPPTETDVATELSGLTRRRATVIGVVLVAAVISVSAGVGFAAQGTGFDWGVASVAGTAIGTTLLAVGTLALAYSTWQDVRASQRIAAATGRSLELTEQDREERLRPAIIGTVTGIDSDAEGAFLSVEIHNIGGGPAVRVQVTAKHRGRRTSFEVGVTPIAWLPAGGSFPLAVRLFPRDGATAGRLLRLSPAGFRVRGEYLDRLARPVPQEIIDWKHDRLPATQ